MESLAKHSNTLPSAPGNLRVHHLHDPISDDLALVREGIAAAQPRLHPKFFYDTAGSALFDAITETPEYYPTRTEAMIFSRHVSQMLANVDNRATLIEPGSGNCGKALRLLQDDKLSHYVPIEISREFLVECCTQLALDHSGLTIDAVCGDFTHCRVLPESVPASGRLVFFPGSTIGNFEPGPAQALLENFRGLAGQGGHLLIGADLPKDPAILEAAYNDAQGITARFNLNMLTHLNSRLDCHFITNDYFHRAFYRADLGRIEMHLVCKRDTRVRVAGEYFDLAVGQSIHTESSYKYSHEQLLRLARRAGFEPVAQWTDPRQWFAVHLLRAT